MARGDECKTATKANIACKHLDVVPPLKKPVTSLPVAPPPKKEQKNYGVWGSTFKDKKNFVEMHLC